MPSTYSQTQSYELMTNQEDIGSWGDKTNNNLRAIDKRFGQQITLGTGGTGGSPPANGNYIIPVTAANYNMYNLMSSVTVSGQLNVMFPAPSPGAPNFYNGAFGIFAVVNASTPSGNNSVFWGCANSSGGFAGQVVMLAHNTFNLLWTDGINVFFAAQSAPVAASPNVVAPTSPVPIGAIMDFAGAYAIPWGWVPCDGRALNINQFPELYAVLGSGQWYGQGYFGSSTTFGIPDLRGAVTAGWDQSGSNLRLPFSSGFGGPPLGNVNNVPPTASGALEGVATVALSADELPAHTHDMSHLHYLFTGTVPPGGSGPVSGAQFLFHHVAGATGSPNVTTNFSIALTNLGAGKNTDGFAQNTGGMNTTTTNGGNGLAGNVHINYQPTFIMQKIIYTGRQYTS